MRRLIAALSLVALANLIFAQAGSTCPLARGAHHAQQAPAPAAGMHEGHDMSAMSNHDTAQSAPDRDSTHAPACLTMGPCALALDVIEVVVTVEPRPDAQNVLAGSYRLPPSLTTSPELPPPRA